MKKEGPCFHCGIDDTLLWRNGPPEKPILCNACGTRYRIRGTLENYVPKYLQSLACKSTTKFKKVQIFDKSCTSTSYLSCNKSKLVTTAQISTSTAENNCSDVKPDKKPDRNPIPDDHETTRRPLLDFRVPKRQRSSVYQLPDSPVDKLHRDLLRIMKEDPSIVGKSKDGKLLYNVNNHSTTDPAEIGLGGVLLCN